jgi:hypothetical protein
MSLFSYAEVSTIVPYYGNIEYGDEGHRKDGNLYGVYASRGDLSYLMEFSYLHNVINDKQSQNASLEQDEFTFVYGHYFTDISYKLGLHYIHTDDLDLGDGYTLIAGVSKWKWFDYDKLTYGADFYNSYYSDGRDLSGRQTPIYVNQLTPHISYLKSFGKNSSNLFSIKANYEYVPLFLDDHSYTSYEFHNTFYYKDFSMGAGLFKGRMRVGIQDNGMTIFNLKDVQTGGYRANVSYDFNKKFNANLAYIRSEYDEFLSHKDIESSTVILSLKRTF